MGRACCWPSWIRQPHLWKFFYLDDMATWCRRRTWKPSVPNAWPYVWFTRGRVLNQTPTSYNLRDSRSFILDIPYSYGRSESAAEFGNTGGPLTQWTWIGLPLRFCSSGPHQHRPPSVVYLAPSKICLWHEGPNKERRIFRAGRTTCLCECDIEYIGLYRAELEW